MIKVFCESFLWMQKVFYINIIPMLCLYFQHKSKCMLPWSNRLWVSVVIEWVSQWMIQLVREKVTTHFSIFQFFFPLKQKVYQYKFLVNLCRYECGLGRQFKVPVDETLRPQDQVLQTYQSRELYCNWNRSWTPVNEIDECVWVQCINPPQVSSCSLIQHHCIFKCIASL